MTQQANRIWFFLRLSFVFSLHSWCFRSRQELEELRHCGNQSCVGLELCVSAQNIFLRKRIAQGHGEPLGWLTTATLCSPEVTLLLQALPPRGTPQPASTPFSLPHSLFFKFSLPYGWQLWMHMQLNKLSMESHSPPPCHIHFSSSQNDNVFNSGN